MAKYKVTIEYESKGMEYNKETREFEAKKQQEARKKAKAYINSQHKTGKVIDIEKIKQSI